MRTLGRRDDVIVKTIALRFSDVIAPPDGSIKEHQKLIESDGCVWWGKFGSPISQRVKKEVLGEKSPRILLVKSATPDRYWAFIDAIGACLPADAPFPKYYEEQRSKIHAWFRVIRFEKAPKDIMSKCRVVSSGAPLSEASKASMSPYFYVEMENPDE